MKPHIRRYQSAGRVRRPHWACFDKSVSGIGSNPFEAYMDWASIRVMVQALSPNRDKSKG